MISAAHSPLHWRLAHPCDELGSSTNKYAFSGSASHREPVVTYACSHVNWKFQNDHRALALLMYVYVSDLGVVETSQSSNSKKSSERIVLLGDSEWSKNVTHASRLLRKSIQSSCFKRSASSWSNSPNNSSRTACKTEEKNNVYKRFLSLK